MSETRDLIGIYGALGRAAKERGDEVRVFVPAFTDENADWIDDFAEWTHEKREEHPFPDFDEALRNLAERRVTGAAAVRRIFALGAAMRGFPELGDPESERGQAAMASLTATGLGARRRTTKLLEALASNKPFERPGILRGEALEAWWAGVARAASGATERTAEAIVALRPWCTGKLVQIALPGAPPYAAKLITSFRTKQVTFERACAFLAPENWPDCHPFWCKMKFIETRPSGKRHYREEVSADCDDAAAWRIAVHLDFTFHKEPDRAVTTYELAENPPAGEDEVWVNEGTLVVDRWDGGVEVATTKRLLFRREPPSPELMATVLCLVGYGSAVEDLVFGCAIDPTKQPQESFPADDGGAQTTAGAGGGPSLLDALATRCALALRRCLDRGAQKGAESRARMRQGSYGADALARDAVDVAVHSLKEATEGLRGGVRASRRAATAERERNRRGGSRT